jgi:hypothetical protein
VFESFVLVDLFFVVAAVDDAEPFAAALHLVDVPNACRSAFKFVVESSSNLFPSFPMNNF